MLHHEAQQSDGSQHAEKTEHQQQRQKDHPIPGESTPGLERTTRGLQRVIQIAKHQRADQQEGQRYVQIQSAEHGRSLLRPCRLLQSR